MQTILFDLDGTLHDSESCYIQACCGSLELFKKRKLTEEEKSYLIGKPITRIIDEWFNDQKDEVLATFFKHYEMCNNHVKKYNGIYDILTELKNRQVTMGIVSSKYKKYIVQELLHTELYPFFNVIVGLDDCKKPKPNPEPLLKAVNELQIEPKDCLYIGDQPTDILAANAAGIMSFGALWGEGTKDKLEGAFPTALLQKPEDILVIHRN
ncbi:HAD-IA family hydrolase [Lysinibacillus sp. Bpr_S20]|uniref:HAD family hydrolase n=1 Tax=Lysinibacillus sp. Bpr_S20 TaxID=2933964 RepID=UPI002011F1ED|nr:HAD-IA family hydrolase [Lysinibacillus sp. Bpr_S20]MCL1699698.1 HAD-IA family hydrolase [Lysinibacillus sp. Bpr_S20]